MKQWDSSSEMTVTPALAAKWLDGADNFRALHRRHLMDLKKAMLEGNFTNNGDPIRIDPKGNCVDGQHRLTALIGSGMPQSMTVITGFRGDIGLLDTGRQVRTLTQYLKHENVARASLISSIVGRIMFNDHSEGHTFKWHSDCVVSPAQIPQMVIYYNENKETLTEAARVASTIRKLISASWGGALWILMSRIDRETAECFFAALAGNPTEDLKGNDPIFPLIQRLLLSKSGSDKWKLPAQTKAAYMVKTWNSWRTGTPILNLRWRKVGPKAESFPDII